MTNKIKQFIKNIKYKRAILLSITVVSFVMIALGLLYLRINMDKEAEVNGVSEVVAPRFVIPEEAYENLEEQKDGKCKGLYKINKVPGEDIRCTYGPEVSFVNSTKVNGGNETPGLGVQCSGDNTSGMRVQAIYAYAEDQADRYDELVPYFRGVADNVSNSFSASAKITDGTALLKWVTNGNCEIEIAKVKMKSTEDDSFSETISAVMRSGHDEPGKLYMIWTEANLVCGIADFISDDNPDPNTNYSSKGTIARYNRIDKSCWGQSELHEIVHSMGAVQHTAPHATGRGHCFDGYDAMCYGDGGVSVDGEGARDCSIEFAYYLDCNGDDYFSANPDPGSYLATHWNLFSSNYLITNKTKKPDPTDTTPPQRAYDVDVYDVIQDGFKVRWKLSGTKDIAKVYVQVNGRTKVVLLGPKTNTYTFGLSPSTTYTAQVITEDANQNKAYSKKVQLTTLATPISSSPPPSASAPKAPPAKLGSIIPHDVKIKSINGSVVVLTAIIDRTPGSSVTYVPWRSNGTGSGGYSWSATNTPKTYEFIDTYVYPQTVVNYHIRVLRATGGEIARSETVPFNFSGSPESNPPPAPTGGTIRQGLSGGAYYYIEYNQMVDDSGTVHHYKYTITGPNGYSYVSGDTNKFLHPSPYLESGKTYTVNARTVDIWGNSSATATQVFTIP